VRRGGPWGGRKRKEQGRNRKQEPSVKAPKKLCVFAAKENTKEQLGVLCGLKKKQVLLWGIQGAEQARTVV